MLLGTWFFWLRFDSAMMLSTWIPFVIVLFGLYRVAFHLDYHFLRHLLCSTFLCDIFAQAL